MSSQSNYPDCTEKCRSTQHGDIITAAISKRSISDVDLCSYLNYVCTCCESVRDSAGRTALHVAASCGRLNLVKWLVQNRHANINAKDEESGYTALHRSIFYGKIDVAVELLKLGANPQLQDSEALTYLDHSMKDIVEPGFAASVCDTELYVWGANSNNSLGPQKARNIPEMMDVFHREHPNETVRQVCVGQFHSVIVTSRGYLNEPGGAFSCGHGQGGRLGLGTEQTVVAPQMVTFPEGRRGEVVECVSAGVSRDHSVFLGSDGNVYTCGRNENRVLGMAPPPRELLVPRPVRRPPIEVQGVCASRYHSVAWGPEGLYVWGMNAGQLGHHLKNEKYILTPKQVVVDHLSSTRIRNVASSDGAIAIYSERGDICVLHEYRCRKIASRQLNIVAVSVTGGKLELPDDKEFSDERGHELKVAALTNTGDLLLWRESDPQLCRCVFSLSRALVVGQAVLNDDGVLFVTADGEAFSGAIRPRRKRGNAADREKGERTAFHRFLERDDCVYVKVTRIQRIHRAVCIESDPKGRDYCVIQEKPQRVPLFPGESEFEIKDDFRRFFEGTDECDIHDITFKVADEFFHAHRFIVSSKSPHLAKLMEDAGDVVTLDSVDPAIFKQLLMFIYTGSCDVIETDKFRNRKNPLSEIGGDKNQANNESSESRAVKLLRDLAKKLGVKDLHKLLSKVDVNHLGPWENTRHIKPFSRDAFPHLYDVTIKCKDGKELRAHKCVLAARLEYFRFLFSMRWQGGETSEVTLPFSKPVVESLLEYLYADSLETIGADHMDHLLNLLILADHLVAAGLKSLCESLLSGMLTLKNAVQLLAFTRELNNARKLSGCCMRFVTANLAAFLESNGLDGLDEGALKELSEVYFKEKRLQCRVLTPYSTAAGDDEIERVAREFPVNLGAEVDRTKAMQKRRSRIHKSTSEKHGSVSGDTADNPDSIIQFPDTPDTPKPVSDGIIVNRLKSITSAIEKVKDTPIETDFSTLSASFNDGLDFPELGSPPNNVCHRTPPKESSKHKMAKVSQRQRKRLSSESGNAAERGPLAESPKNPWKVLPEIAGSGMSLQDKGVSDIGRIISDEKRQKENLVKITSKSLRLTQIEDKAIEDLHKFYNTENVTDELITIERVSIGAIASPVWVPRTK